MNRWMGYITAKDGFAEVEHGAEYNYTWFTQNQA